MARIKVTEYHEASGRLLEIYNDLIRKRGKLAEVHKIQSLRPESIEKHIDLYLEIMFSRSELSRADREMMAVVVSVKNGCEYCRLHHAEALNQYWKNDKKTEQFITDYRNAGLTETQIILCEFAENLTVNPSQFDDPQGTEKLRSAGLSDQAILDATLVVAYFNFVNRIVQALGVESSEEEIRGYLS